MNTKTAKAASLAGLSRNREKEIVVAVAGNPNTGKSTLINALTGARLSVGNWPGVTVGKKSVSLSWRGRTLHIVDLPGVYSLSPYSREERIARDYLVSERPDVILNVVDATNLERNLYLTLQLLELGAPVVVALNMMDEARSKGLRIDSQVLATLLGSAAVPTAAVKNDGLEGLLEAVMEQADTSNRERPEGIFYGNDIEEAASRLLESLTAEKAPYLVERLPRRWLALKILEGDEAVLEETGLEPSSPLRLDATRHLREAHGEDLETLLSDVRYGLAAGLVREVVQRPAQGKREFTERIDAILLHRLWGLPLFFAAMWLLFKLTFDLSAPFTDWIDGVFSGPVSRQSGALLHWLGAPAWTVSLVTEGIIGGAGMVLTFTPAIFTMMFFITLLEGSGYMARAAFIMDRAMHAIGLHGKSFIPLLLGFGCNVPAIYATRTLETSRDRALTALLVPLMSCGARLPVYVIFTGAFFSASAGTVLWSLYVLGIVLAVAMGLLFKKTLFRTEAPLFIMELPPYRPPSLRNLLVHTWEKGRHFLVKAGTYILTMAVLVWFLLNLPWGVEQKRDSYLGQVGAATAPLFAPLGFGAWEASASLISGVVAKEIVVTAMAEIYAARAGGDHPEKPSLGQDVQEILVSFASACREAAVNVFSTFGMASMAAEEEEGASGITKAVVSAFTPLSAYAFMAFVLLYMPCIVVLAAMRDELGSWKWPALAVGYQTVLAWVTAFVLYQGGTLLGLS